MNSPQYVTLHGGSPHCVTMQFDLTTEEGREAFEYARLGEASHIVLWKLWNEMSTYLQETYAGDQITHQWLQRILELMDDYHVPLDI